MPWRQLKIMRVRPLHADHGQHHSPAQHRSGWEAPSAITVVTRPEAYPGFSTTPLPYAAVAWGGPHVGSPGPPRMRGPPPGRWRRGRSWDRLQNAQCRRVGIDLHPHATCSAYGCWSMSHWGGAQQPLHRGADGDRRQPGARGLSGRSGHRGHCGAGIRAGTGSTAHRNRARHHCITELQPHHRILPNLPLTVTRLGGG